MKNPELHYRGDLPYDSYTEYLVELCACMDIYLMDYVRKFGLPGGMAGGAGRDAGGLYGGAGRGANEGSDRGSYGGAGRGAYGGADRGGDGGAGRDDRAAALDGRCRQVLAFLEKQLAGRGLKGKQDCGLWERMIEERRSFTVDIGGVLPLEQLLKRYGGDGFIRRVLILVLMGRLNGQYRAFFDMTPAMCARLFLMPGSCSDVRVYMSVQKYLAVLCRIFPELLSAEDVSHAELVCDERLTDIIVGLNRYLPCGTVVYDGSAAAPLFGGEDAANGGSASAPLFGGEDAANGSSAAAPIFGGEDATNGGSASAQLFGAAGLLPRLEQLLDAGITPVLLKAPAGAGKKHMLRHLARKKGISLIFYDLAEGYLPETGFQELKKHILYVVRECRLYAHHLVLTSLELLSVGDMKQLTGWLKSELCGHIPGIYLTAGADDSQTLPILELVTLEFPPLDAGGRIAAWEYFLRDCPVASDFTPEAVANAFVLTPGQIQSAVRHGKLMAGGGVVDIQTLYHACYVQLDHRLAQKASRVKTSFGWADLKLEAADKAVLRDVCNCVKNRHIVLDHWQFSSVVPYGGGITVLFAGPPGTGKTMAAQVIANELHMELYKIDLSQVIDKYVGETEKNIRMIFTQAKKSSSILFFDEADSIFNRRMEASNANERFANIESSLLLQCIEEYNGITILATNHFSAIDNAFIRRFKYYLLFKEPDADVRYEIWKSVFPAAAPLNARVDLRELARTFEFTGAVIKNVALAAAYLAAQEQREILLVDILKAIRREMAKNNLILTREKLGSLCYMFDEMMAESDCLVD